MPTCTLYPRPLVAGTLALLWGEISPAFAQTTAPAPQPDRPYTGVELLGSTGRSYQLFDAPSGQGNIRRGRGYAQTYQVAGLGLQHSFVLEGYLNMLVGLRGFAGGARFLHSERLVSTNPLVIVPLPDSTRRLYSLNPYVELWGAIEEDLVFRLGAGWHWGHLAYDEPTRFGRFRRRGPDVLLEAGYHRWALLHLSLWHGADGVGNGTARLGLGTGLGRPDFTLWAGLALTHSNGNDTFYLYGQPPYQSPLPLYAEVRWRPGRHWQLTATGTHNFNDMRQLQLSTSYRLYH